MLTPLFFLLSACAPDVPAERAALTPEYISSARGESFFERIVTIPLNGEALLADRQLGRDIASGSYDVLLEVFAYCALENGDELVIGEGEDARAFPGWMGIWTDWEEQPCEEECQEAITSCVLPKINVYGITVQILFNGDRYPQGDDSLGDTYPIQEGAFWGNMFANPRTAYSCVGDGMDAFHRAFRTCTQEGNGCGFQYLGTCGNFNGATGETSATRACEGYDEESWRYYGCHDQPSDENGNFPADSRVYRHPTTTYIKNSHMIPGEDTCFDP